MLKAFVIGNLGRDPEMRYLQDGTPVCSFSVASTVGRGDKQTTEWVAVSVFGKQGESCSQYLSKGRQVFVEGRLTTRAYTTSAGEQRFSLDLTADTVQFIGSRDAGEKVGVAAEQGQETDLESIPF